MRIKNILLIITAMTIVSCNDVRKSETWRVLEDCMTMARTYFSQGNIYSNLYNWDKYITCNIYAAENFKKAVLTNR